jgi:integrase
MRPGRVPWRGVAQEGSAQLEVALPVLADRLLPIEEVSAMDQVIIGVDPHKLSVTIEARTGTPIEPRNFNRVFERRIAKVGVSKITVHGTRKTCGTLLAALYVHPRVAMQILRHSKIAVTMDI